MAMPQITPAQGEWTADAMWELPEDGNRYEIIDGVLYVTPTPRPLHQFAVESLGDILKPFIREQGLGILLRVGADLRPRDKTVVQPDIFVAPLMNGRRPATWEEMSHLVLAVEVLSKRTAARDRGVKRKLYQQCADEYWIVDLDARLIERWRPGDARPEILDETIVWHPKGATSTLEIDLPAFFKDVWDE